MEPRILIPLISDSASFELDLDNIGTDFTFTRASSATYVDVNGTIQTALTNIPRIDYSDGSPALLLEPASTNLITYSEDFSNALWRNFFTTDAGGENAPDGSVNAFKIIGTADDNWHGIYISGLVTQDSNTYTRSIYVKKGNQRYLNFSSYIYPNDSLWTNVFDFDTGNWTHECTGGAIHEPLVLADGWFKLSFKADATGVGYTGFWVGMQNHPTNIGISTYYDATGDYFYIFGAGIEQLSFSTSYIPTSGATATRATELCINGGSASVINSEEGVLYVEMSALGDDLTVREITFSDNTTTNKISINYNTTTQQIKADVIVGGVSQASLTKVVTDITDFNKIALKYKANDFALWVNGVEEATDTSGTTFSADTLTEINYNEGDASGGEFYGKVRSLKVYKEALSDSALEKLTT